METTQIFISKHADRFLNELISLIKIPSVSADPAYKSDVIDCSKHLANSFKEIGLDKIEICQTAGYPIVYGEKIIDPSLPTVLVYGHYDVQPADPIDLWTSPPFEPVKKKQKFIQQEQFSLEVHATTRDKCSCI